MNCKKKLALMGKIVTVTHEFVRHYGPDNGSREWKASKLLHPRAGWIVGFRTLQNGFYNYGSYEDQPYLDVKSTVGCVLVSYWPTTKPIKVPVGIGWIEGGVPKFAQYPWSDEDREDLRKIMKDVPRDIKGKWTK
uniref:Uncharacterized protein n=1 Tax=viral metagenome TaxID=1070528 RepID=A0A6M3LL73_9ZZZZ